MIGAVTLEAVPLALIETAFPSKSRKDLISERATSVISSGNITVM
jgi:hypothetical protein